MIVRIQGIKRYRHPRTGIWYTYHRKSGTRLEPPHEFGSGAFFAALKAAEAKHRSEGSTVGTWGSLVISYRTSPEFETLKKRTKTDYLRLLDYLKGIEAMPVWGIDTPFLYRLQAKAYKERKRKFANYIIQIISVVFKHAVKRGLAADNPAKGMEKIRRPTNAPIANRAWTAEEKRVVLEHAPAHLLIPIAVARWTGLREGDVISLQRSAYRDGTLNLTTGKRGVPHWWPCPAPLREILDAIPAHAGLTLCVNSYGHPWTESGFRTSFFKLIRKLERAGLVNGGLTFHGLRTSFAEEASENGFTTEAIAHALAHKDAKSASHYTRNADRKRSIKAVSDSLDRTNDGQNLSTKVSTMAFKKRRLEPK